MFRWMFGELPFGGVDPPEVMVSDQFHNQLRKGGRHRPPILRVLRVSSTPIHLGSLAVLIAARGGNSKDMQPEVIGRQSKYISAVLSS